MNNSSRRINVTPNDRDLWDARGCWACLDELLSDGRQLAEVHRIAVIDPIDLCKRHQRVLVSLDH